MPVGIELDGVSFAYPGGPDVLQDVSLHVEPGEFVAIAGPNGGGKTTLMRLILGLEHARAGTVRLSGHARHSVAYLAQRAALGIEAPITVREVVTSGRAAATGLIGRLGARDRELVTAAIERVGLAGHARTPLLRLSGGQQQRALIAKALAAEPELLVLDEPTTGVDVDAQDALAELLAELHDETKATILYVSHEFGAVERLVERIVLVRRTIVYDGPPSALPSTWHDPSHSHA
jgi:ABC-type Mn2+/Zn2+ transport system ATPase subunit